MRFLKILLVISIVAGLVPAQSRTGRLTGSLITTDGSVSGRKMALFVRGGASVGEAATDADGNFEFAGLAPGSYEVVLVCDNCTLAPQRVAVTVTAGRTTVVGYRPNGDPTISATVTIAADIEQTFESVTKSVSVIDGQEMRDRADFALAESLRTIPGFRVQQLGGFGRTASVKTRGLRNQDTAVLIDGVRFRDASAITGDASAFISDFTLTNVSRIEVLRGAGSSLYGTNAIGGAIDFQTPKPQNGFHGQIGGAFGGLGLGRFRGNVSRGWDRIGITAGLSRTSFTEGIDGQDDANNTNVQTRIEFDPTVRTNISARFFFSDADVRLNSNPDTLGALPATNAAIINARPGINFAFDANDPDNIQGSRFFNGQLAASHVFNEKFTLRGFYSGLTTRRRNENGVLGVGFQGASTSIFEGGIKTLNAQGIYTANRFSQLSFGAEFESESFRNDGFTPSGAGSFTTTARQRSTTVYVQELVTLLGGSLQFAGGLRGQFFGLDSPRFSASNAPYANLSLPTPPRALTYDGAVSYFVRRTGTKFRAHIGNGYRIPSLYERFGTFFSTFSRSFVALGDPNLRPEKSLAVDGGIDQRFWGGRATFGATYFYTRLDETVGFGNVVPAIGTTTRPFGGYFNTRGGIARGVELESRIKPFRATEIFTSYTFTNSDQRVPQVTGNSSLRTLGIPDHQFTMVATQRFGRAWINFDLLATGSYLAPIFSNSTFRTYVYRFDGNRRGDLTGGYTFPLKKDQFSLRVFATVENLFDNEYFENGFRTVGANGRVGVSFGF